MTGSFASQLELQHTLFARLSAMFGKEVPLYDKSLLVNAACNRTVCDLLAHRFQGFEVSDAQLEKTSGERHGAIRIGRPDEYQWIARFFARFGMHPHNFYDMTSVGAKSQPVIATAFRSLVHPEHRVFCSLLQTSYFDAETKARVDALLAQRQVFSDQVKALIEAGERQGGLTQEQGEALITEATTSIFKWTGRARDHDLYTHLCQAGFKIAADIACFEAHHLNHLTPNTFCMDLYTAAMKFRMGQIDETRFATLAQRALGHLLGTAGVDELRLLFKHLERDEVMAFDIQDVSEQDIDHAIRSLVASLDTETLDLTRLPHSGFKDTTEGPPRGVPLLLRQDAYKALTERVVFTNPDGSTIETEHTARFGEIEQRFYATTPAGRALYDECLAAAQAAGDDRPPTDGATPEQREAAYTTHFDRFPTTLQGLLEQGFVYARYEPTPAGRAARGSIDTTDITTLCERGLAARDGLRYEDFLPVSAAGIFASNLSQYGTRSSAAERPTYTQAMLEEALGCPIIDADAVYRGLQAASLLHTYEELGLLDQLPQVQRETLRSEAAALPHDTGDRYTERSLLAARA